MTNELDPNELLLHPDDEGGDDPDSDYPFLTEYQTQCVQDLITVAEFAYEASPIETMTPDNQKEVEAAEKRIFAYIGLLLADRDARIKELEARQITPEMEALLNKIKLAYDQADEHMLLRRLLPMMIDALEGDAP